jgi:type VI secretion system protein ImpA
LPVASPAALDLDALLSPVRGENPSGENLQYSGLHDELREARRADDDVPQGAWVRELKAADWDKVVRLATDSLASRTKDLQIVAWLSEAEIALNGFEGLRDCLKLAHGYLEAFWETLYPEVDEGNDLEARANALAWMDRQAALAIKRVPLTKRAGANYSFFQWEDAKLLDGSADRSGASSEASQDQERARLDGKPTGEEIRKARSETRRAFYDQLFSVVEECGKALGELDRVMDLRFERQTPGLGALTKALDEVRHAVERTLQEKRLEEPDASDASGATETAAAGGTGARSGAAGGPLRDRDQALAQLAQVADYFRRTEPHSPVSYLVQRAISWGQMPLDGWLRDVIKDASILANLRETLGLRGDAGDSGSGS